MADEVYQENIYQSKTPFTSCKKVGLVVKSLAFSLGRIARWVPATRLNTEYKLKARETLHAGLLSRLERFSQKQEANFGLYPFIHKRVRDALVGRHAWVMFALFFVFVSI